MKLYYLLCFFILGSSAHAVEFTPLWNELPPDISLKKKDNAAINENEGVLSQRVNTKFGAVTEIYKITVMKEEIRSEFALSGKNHIKKTIISKRRLIPDTNKNKNPWFKEIVEESEIVEME